MSLLNWLVLNFLRNRSSAEIYFFYYSEQNNHEVQFYSPSDFHFHFVLIHSDGHLKLDIMVLSATSILASR